MIVYIAGPYTKGNVEANVGNAIRAGEQVIKLGHTPYVPHLTHFWHLIYPHPVDFWYEYDLEFLRFCDCVWRLPGDSVGADNEVLFAEDNHMPIVHSIEELEFLYRR